MSFWEYVGVFFIVMPIVLIWGLCLVQIVARPDLRVWMKVAWVAGVVLLPLVGMIAYFATAARKGPVDETKEWEDRSAEEIEDAVYQSTHLTASQRLDDMFR